MQIQPYIARGANSSRRKVPVGHQASGTSLEGDLDTPWRSAATQREDLAAALIPAHGWSRLIDVVLMPY